MIAMNSLMLRSMALGLLATAPLPASHSQPNPPLVAPRAAMQVTQSPAWNGTTASNTPLQRLAAVPSSAESTAPEPSPAAVTDPALDIVLVLDNSGSMKQNDPQLLTREVVTRFLEGISANTRMGMVVFDQDARLIEPLTALDSLNAKIRFLKGLESLNYQGRYTNSPVAIERALYELRIHGREQGGKIVIFLTDGIVDTGDSARDREKEQWLKDSLTVESQKLGIRLFTIAFTDRADYQLIQTLAMKTGGEYFRAYQAKEIEGVFKTINARLAPARPAAGEAAVQPSVVSPPPAPSSPTPTAPVVPPVAPSPPPQSGLPLSLWLMGGVASAGVFIALVLFMRRGSRAPTPNGRPAAVASTASQLPLPQAELLDLKGTVFQQPVPLTQRRIRIGRTADNDIVIPGEGVSALHATIHYQDGVFYLEDQRSSNGTWLNDDRKRLEPHHPIRLKSGDRIRFDACTLAFMAAQQPGAGGTILAQDRPQGPSGTILAQPEPPSASAPPAPHQASVIAPAPKPNQTMTQETRLKTLMCPHHASLKAEELCGVCQKAFCKLCIDEIAGKTICKTCQAQPAQSGLSAGA